MKTKLAHPLWTHLPALTALIIMLVYLFTSLPLPAGAPVHFGFSGEPDRYGSPWELIGLSIGLSVLFIILSVFIDEIWARQEKKKAFNWLCWLDDVTVGWMAGVSIGYLVFLRDGADTFDFPWNYAGLMAGGATLLGLVLESLRPYRPYPGKPVVRETKEFEAELDRQLKESTSFVYWDNQNPFYVTLLATLLPLVMFASAVLVWFDPPWVSSMLVIVGIALLFPYGGQRILVNRQDITVRWGLVGVKVLNLKTAEVASVELHEFAPLRDFGGYGIRFNMEMKAYYLRGSRGVKITMANGKKYLIGSDHPERLSTVIGLITGKR